MEAWISSRIAISRAAFLTRTTLALQNAPSRKQLTIHQGIQTHPRLRTGARAFSVVLRTPCVIWNRSRSSSRRRPGSPGIARASRCSFVIDPDAEGDSDPKPLDTAIPAGVGRNRHPWNHSGPGAGQALPDPHHTRPRRPYRHRLVDAQRSHGIRSVADDYLSSGGDCIDSLAKRGVVLSAQENPAECQDSTDEGGVRMGRGLHHQARKWTEDHAHGRR
jgi:hypothetical protein